MIHIIIFLLLTIAMPHSQGMAGRQVNCQNNQHYQDARRACQEGCIPCINRYVREKSTDHRWSINNPLPTSAMNPLHWAVIGNKLDLIAYLVTKLGANINEPVRSGEFRGKSPLYVAVYHLPITEHSLHFLLEHPLVIKDAEALALHEQKLHPPQKDVDDDWVAVPDRKLPQNDSWVEDCSV